MRKNLAHLAAALALCLATVPARANYIYTPFDAPGVPNGTTANGINDAGAIVGAYPGHGYLLSPGGAFTTIDFPGAVTTGANGVTAAGAMVGGTPSPASPRSATCSAGAPSPTSTYRAPPPPAPAPSAPRAPSSGFTTPQRDGSASCTKTGPIRRSTWGRISSPSDQRPRADRRLVLRDRSRLPAGPERELYDH